MKWKDSVDMVDEEEQSRDEFFDEKRYSPWTDRKESKVLHRINRPPVLFILLILAIVALVAALLMLLWGGSGNVVTRTAVSALEDRVRQLEERLDKFEAVDEKVTRIWEQAKSFEKFKDRFDRSEASTSLRMDHLTMSLESLQKQLSDMPKAAPAPSAEPATRNAKPASVRYHQVAPSETFYSISKMYDLTVEDLLKMNHLTKNDVLKVGQKLSVGGVIEKK